MHNGVQGEDDITKNKVNLEWGAKQVLGTKIDNLQMTANQILREVQAIQIKKEMLSGKARRTPLLYASAIIDDASDFHNINGDDNMHKAAEQRRVEFLREIAEHILDYCNHNEG